MDKRQKIIIAILGAMLVTALTVLIVVAVTRRPEVIVSEFQAPPFEEHARSGIPEDAENIPSYREITVENNYTFALCGEPTLVGNNLRVLFTSHEENRAWLLLRVYDINGTQIGTSGILRAGEYVEHITLTAIPTEGAVRVKVLSYEPDTYYSLGTASATLPITIQNP